MCFAVIPGMRPHCQSVAAFQSIFHHFISDTIFQNNCGTPLPIYYVHKCRYQRYIGSNEFLKVSLPGLLVIKTVFAFQSQPIFEQLLTT